MNFMLLKHIGSTARGQEHDHMEVAHYMKNFEAGYMPLR
jgi:hypothetical protein